MRTSVRRDVRPRPGTDQARHDAAVGIGSARRCRLAYRATPTNISDTRLERSRCAMLTTPRTNSATAESMRSAIARCRTAAGSQSIWTSPSSAARNAARETKKFLDTIIANIPFAVIVKDATTRQFLLVNRAFETMLGIPRSELAGQDHIRHPSEQRTPRIIDNARQRNAPEQRRRHLHEYEVEHAEAAVTACRPPSHRHRNPQGEAKYLIAVVEDVTERKKSEQRIAFMAHHDAVDRSRQSRGRDTEDRRGRRASSPARRTVYRSAYGSRPVQKRQRYARPFRRRHAVAGSRGAPEDASFAKRDVLARLGGDEFAVIQSGESNQREAASALADRIIEVIGKPFDIDGTEVNIGTSIGIAMAPEHGTDPDKLLKMADMALYGAKSAGRNGYRFFDPEMGAAVNARICSTTNCAAPSSRMSWCCITSRSSTPRRAGFAPRRRWCAGGIRPKA